MEPQSVFKAETEAAKFSIELFPWGLGLLGVVEATGPVDGDVGRLLVELDRRGDAPSGGELAELVEAVEHGAVLWGSNEWSNDFRIFLARFLQVLGRDKLVKTSIVQI